MRILRDLISPTLSSFRGLKPHHDTRDDAVNIFMSAPISANMEAAERSLTPGIVWRFSNSLGNSFESASLAYASEKDLFLPDTDQLNQCQLPIWRTSIS